MSPTDSDDQSGSSDTTDEHAKRSAEENLDESSGRERAATEAGSRPSAALIHELIRAEGEQEVQRTASALLLSGFAAGLSMGFSLIVSGLLKAHLPATPGFELIVDLGYTVGFLVVVLGRQQLFTENTLTPILPLLHHRDARMLWQVARLWALVLAANVAATWVFALILAHTGSFEPDVKAAFSEISGKTVALPFATTMIRAVFAGWLIALMVWLLPAAGSARPWMVIVITYVVALGDFGHIIAGSADAAFLVAEGQASAREYLFTFFLPTLTGNILGGVALVAVLNYGQVAPEIRE